MGYILDHTVFFELSWLSVAAAVFMFATLIFCICRVQKMKKELRTTETELSAKLADVAIGKTEPIMENSIDKIGQ